MMELELKHIAPYLPYKLKVRHPEGDLIMMGIKDDGGRIREEHEVVEDPQFTLVVCRKEKHRYRPYSNFFIQSGFKPLLRPLSDLTQEIEHNGERFVPDEQLCGALKELDYIVGHHNDYFSFRKNLYANKGFSFSEYQKLLEWHFDIFGLIQAGLAIDINTIKQ